MYQRVVSDSGDVRLGGGISFDRGDNIPLSPNN